MTLGTAALSRAIILLPLLPLVLMATAGCAADRRDAVERPAARSTAPPTFSLGHSEAAKTVRTVARSLPSLHRKVTSCPGDPTCNGVASSRWYASAQRDGARLDGGNGFGDRAYLGVVAFHSPRTARHFVVHLRRLHRRYAGVVSIALKPGRGGHYTPGETGVGDLSGVAGHGWHGWVLDLQHAYTFDDGSQSAMEYTRRFMARRGRFVCAAYLDARSLPELRRYVPAWNRLVTALGR
jgi:hypothetical protein